MCSDILRFGEEATKPEEVQTEQNLTQDSRFNFEAQAGEEQSLTQDRLGEQGKLEDESTDVESASGLEDMQSSIGDLDLAAAAAPAPFLAAPSPRLPHAGSVKRGRGARTPTVPLASHGGGRCQGWAAKGARRQVESPGVASAASVDLEGLRRFLAEYQARNPEEVAARAAAVAAGEGVGAPRVQAPGPGKPQRAVRSCATTGAAAAAAAAPHNRRRGTCRCRVAAHFFGGGRGRPPGLRLLHWPRRRRCPRCLAVRPPRPHRERGGLARLRPACTPLCAARPSST